MSARDDADFHGPTAYATDDVAIAANVGAIVAACIAAADAVIAAADALRLAQLRDDTPWLADPLP
jgi:hypothetical protein